MGCELDKVVTAINKVASEVKDPRAINQLNELKNDLNKFATSMETAKPTRDFSRLKSVMSNVEVKATSNNSEVIGTVKTLPREYYNTLNKIVRKILGPKVTTSEYLAFSQATLKNISIVGGQYARGKVLLSKKPRQAALEAQAQGIFEKWYLDDSPYGLEYQNIDDPQDFVDALAKDEIYKELKEGLLPLVQKEMIEGFATINGMHTLAHELVHVGSIEYMKENPNSDLTKFVKDLYKEAVENKEDILWLMGEGRSTYWTNSVEEFIAEGLSNPDLVSALNGTKSKLSNKYRSNMFRLLIDKLLSMLGTKEESTYIYLLSGYLAMLESLPNPKSLNPIIFDKMTYDLKRSRYAKETTAKELFSKADRLNYVNPLIEVLKDEFEVNFRNEDISADLVAENLIEYGYKVLDGNRTHMFNEKMVEAMMVEAKYVAETNTIVYPGKLDNTEERLQTVVKGMFEAFEKESGKAKADAVKSKISKEVEKVTSVAVAKRRKLLRDSKEELKPEVLLHELGHALTENYLIRNSESDVVNELDSIRLSVTDVLMQNKYLAEEDTYWQTNLEEFLSEALSNPTLIRELSKIPVKDIKDVDTILQAIVKFVAGMFGKKYEDSVFDAIMYRLSQIAEEQGKTKSRDELLKRAKIIKESIYAIPINSQTAQDVQGCNK